jgi:hypothetical protein
MMIELMEEGKENIVTEGRSGSEAAPCKIGKTHDRFFSSESLPRTKIKHHVLIGWEMG